MDLAEIVRTQQEFDGEHGWIPASDDANDVCRFLSRDLIGLFGEIGEFANIVKKLQLEPPLSLPEMLANSKPLLAEELVDFFIYVLRVAAYLGIDLESEYFNKLSKNDARFRRYLIRITGSEGDAP